MLYNNYMKQKIINYILSLTMFTSIVAVPVTARALPKAAAQSAVQNTTSETETTEDATARTTRIANYKKDLKETLTTAAKTRLAERCVAAQALLKVKKSNNYSVHASRVEAYDKIAAKLQELSTAASAKGVNVAVLQANITELQIKIDAYKAAYTPYRLALSDLSAIDCKADAVAFKAALETARTKQTEVYDAAKAVRTYLKETVKPTIISIKKALESIEG